MHHDGIKPQQLKTCRDRLNLILRRNKALHLYYIPNDHGRLNPPFFQRYQNPHQGLFPLIRTSFHVGFFSDGVNVCGVLK